jgi:zinc protease
MNFILGGSGSLTSRMGEEIRSNAGKAYDVWSDFGFGRDLGVFRAMAQTALENTDWVVKKIAEMIETMKSGNVTPDETSKAKFAILRSLVFDFETRFAQVREQARFHLWGYPDDYLVRFQKGISAVTPEDVGRVAKGYLHPEGLKTLVVTDEKEAGKLGMPVRSPP